ncbi:hypothetical protein E2C01_038978 [Portunus trituberculatus]|uniref:Uncharacterized protein n=1 Tax=Portunus trituberculatus TaxID=210409 RepID=A0A5B7FFL4_PORTR|nr:hypothetical protein [Portunus trituberculatus]
MLLFPTSRAPYSQNLVNPALQVTHGGAHSSVHLPGFINMQQMMSLPRLRGSGDFSPYASSAEWADYSFALPCQLQQCLQNVLGPLWVRHCAS